MTRWICVAVVVLSLFAGSADAQPAGEPVDPPEVVAQFERGVAALTRGEIAAARRDLEAVARVSVVPRRRDAAAELVRSIDSQGPKPVDDPIDEESGRAQLLGTTILAGLNYGWMVPLALDIDDARGFVGLYLLTAGASFGVPYIVTRNDEITRGMSTLTSGGTFLGIAHGALAFGAIAGEDGFDSDAGIRAMLGVMIGTSIIEGAVAYKWARDSDMSAGNALAISSGSSWGLGFAGGANVLAAGDDTNLRLVLGSMLAGSIAGGFAGKIYGDNRRLTEGDAGLVSLSGGLGAFAAFSPLLIAEVDDSRAVVGSLMAGAAVGLVAGDFATRDVDYGRSEAGLVGLGTAAGGLLGAGGAFLVSPDDNAEKFVVTGAAAGAVAGFLVMLKAVEPEGEPDAVASGSVTPAPTVGMDGTPGFGLAGTF